MSAEAPPSKFDLQDALLARRKGTLPGSHVIRSPSMDEFAKYSDDYCCQFGCSLKTKSIADIEATEKARRQLLKASFFCLLFTVAEATGGYLSNSLALLSDALHMLSDFAGLGISMFSLWLANRNSSHESSFGYHRAEILGALFSIVLIWVLTAGLVFEAIQRLIHPQKIDGEMMFIVACLGILVNVIMGWILFQGGHHTHGLPGSGQPHEHSHGHEHGGGQSPRQRKGDCRNINVRSAFVHVLGDLVQSIGVVLAASFVWYDADAFGFMDPICTLLFSVIVVYTTYHLAKDALHILMENVPRHLDILEIERTLRQVPDVASVHDVHVWNLSVGQIAMSAHLVVKSSTTVDGTVVPLCADAILRVAQRRLQHLFQINHSTLQIEWPRPNHALDEAHPVYCTSPTDDFDSDDDDDDEHAEVRQWRGLAHGHGHGHEHGHGHGHSHEHGHSHGHGHGHGHAHHSVQAHVSGSVQAVDYEIHDSDSEHGHSHSDETGAHLRP